MKKQMTVLTLSLILLFVLPVLPGTAQATRRRVESMQPLGNLLGEIAAPQNVLPAPDGIQVAYEKHLDGENPTAVCAHNLASSEDRCVELPKAQSYHLDISNSDYYPPLCWSPDGNKIALVGVPYRFFKDTDLGVADLTTLKLTVLTEDNYSGTFGFKPLPEGTSIEIQPTWSPDGTQIAVEREVANTGGQLGQATISIFNISDGSVRDLTLLPGHEIYTRDMGSTVSMAWSPDGKTLAVSLRHPQLEPQYDGVWLLDVASGKLTQLVSVAQGIQAVQGIFPGQSEIMFIAPLSWSPDGSRLLFWTGAPDQFAGYQWAFWVEPASGKITPVPLPTDPYDKPQMRMIWPSHAAWSPDGSQLLVVAHHIADPDLTGATLLSPAIEGQQWTSFHIIDVASGQATLLGYAPYAIAARYLGVWSPDGNVIAGGYAFKLAQ